MNTKGLNFMSGAPATGGNPLEPGVDRRWSTLTDTWIPMA
jgi:hypothetical protein